MDQTHSRELDLLFDNSPSVLRNSVFIFVVYLIASISGLISISIGISLLLENARTQLLTGLGLEIWLDKGKITIIENFGLLFLGLGLVLLFTGMLCRMIGRRNHFILELFAWHEAIKREEKKKSEAA